MRRGFSLVELSIVLVILGLLVGGILAGRSLIRASELRAVGTEYQRYKTATHAFRDKYFAVPGDFAQATRVWGRLVANAQCVTNNSAAVNATGGACDGNGDGMIDRATSNSRSGENFQVWRQLALAGLIEGSYTGIAGTNDNDEHIMGENHPVSKLANGGWGAEYATASVASPQNYAVQYGNYFIIGSYNENSKPNRMVMRPEEAWNIDTKLDDGQPGYGIVIARYHNNQCAVPTDGNSDGGADLNGSYNLADTSILCALYFARQY